MKTLAHVRLPAYPDEGGNVPQAILPLRFGEPQSRRGREEFKTALLAAFTRLFDEQGNPRRSDFDERDNAEWILVRKHAYKDGYARMVCYELMERA